MIRVEKFKSGEIRKSIDYKYFIPTLVNTEWLWADSKLNKLLEQASYELGQLNSYAKLVPNVDLFIHLHITKETVVSSKIEGTQTHFDEAFMQKENINPERKDDWQEVQNYDPVKNRDTQPMKLNKITKAGYKKKMLHSLPNGRRAHHNITKELADFVMVRRGRQTSSFNFSTTVSTSALVLCLLKLKRTVTWLGLLLMARIT